MTPTQETTVHLNHTSELATLEHGHSTQRVGSSSAVRDYSQSPFDELHCPVVQLLEVVRGVGHFVLPVSCEGSNAFVYACTLVTTGVRSDYTVDPCLSSGYSKTACLWIVYMKLDLSGGSK